MVQNNELEGGGGDSDYDAEPGWGKYLPATSLPSVSTFIDESTGTVRWGKLMGTVGRGTVYAAFLSLLNVFLDVVEWWQNGLAALAAWPSQVTDSPVAAPLRSAFDTALAAMPDGAFGFLAALTLTVAIGIAINRGLMLLGVR